MDRNEATAGLAELEGYLMSRAAHRSASLEAGAFADELPWLGQAEREDVIRLYTTRHLARTRQLLLEITSRSQELKEEYAHRYQLLRRRALAYALCSGATALTILALGLPMPR